MRNSVYDVCVCVCVILHVRYVSWCGCGVVCFVVFVCAGVEFCGCGVLWVWNIMGAMRYVFCGVGVVWYMCFEA